MNALAHLTPDERADLAMLYVLDALPPEERAAVDAQLGQGDEELQAEIRVAAQSAGDLALSAVPVEPPPGAKAKLLRLANLQSGGTLFDEAGLRIASSRIMDWRPGPHPGMQVKILDVDKPRGFSTQLVRFAPGSEYPAHKHAGVEELLILEGEIEVHGVPMRAGDYCRAEPGSVHLSATSEHGVTIMVRKSLHDELYSEP